MTPKQLILNHSYLSLVILSVVLLIIIDLV
jgi:hypothetical protein